MNDFTDVEENPITIQLYVIVENLVWNSITSPTRFRITTGRHRRNRNSRPPGRQSDENRWSWSLDRCEEWDAFKFILNEGVTQSSGTEGKRDLPALTHCFFCMRCRRNIGMHQWYKFLRKACIFAFVIVLTLTTSTSVLLYQVCMPSSRIAWTRRHEVPCCTY